MTRTQLVTAAVLVMFGVSIVVTTLALAGLIR